MILFFNHFYMLVTREIATSKLARAYRFFYLLINFTLLIEYVKV